MPLYEFECVKCRANIENSFKSIQKKYNKKILTELIKKYDNINSIEVIDIQKEKMIVKAGKRLKKSVFREFYLNDGDILVLFNIQNYRLSELIYEKEDEKKVKCNCGEKKRVERVVSSFAFTSDLSTNMPRPDLSNLPPSVAAKTNLTGYIEEKDRPKGNR
ncbi:MAG: hypothetical protein ACRENO_09055 [Thermodesulfobacteriota bacterium]